MICVSRARCSALRAASQNRDRTKRRRSLRPRLCSTPLRKCYALRCVRGTEAIMILIGQFDSPFVRRVGIALRLYDLPFEHRPWSTFGDADKIAPYNPLRRVPTLVLDDGEMLIESTAILDHLDETVGPSRAMIAESGPPRREALKVC